MILTKTTLVKWASSNRKWYEQFDYEFTKNGDEFEVKVEELAPSSKNKIQCLCDYCLDEGKETLIEITWNSYYRRHGNGKDNCPRHIIAKQKEMNCDNVIKTSHYSNEEIKKMYLNICKKYNKICGIKEIRKERTTSINFFNITDVNNTFGSLSNLYVAVKDEVKKLEEILIYNQIKDYFSKHKLYLSIKQFNKCKELSNFSTIQEKLKSKKINTLLDLYIYCDIKVDKNTEYLLTKDNLSKEQVINIILDMQNNLNRPLMYDDFRNPTTGSVGITIIKKYFGTMNKMKEELGLEIIQEDMVSKHIDDFNIIVKEIKYICDVVYNTEHRKIITVKDLNKLNRLNLNGQIFLKYCKENNTTTRNIIESYGFNLQKEGIGLVYFFDDEEKTASQYELIFSNKLREYGYRFNKDYYRDVRYKEFINDYNDLMNCDYVIHIGNKAIYIELAGMLGGNYETDYKNNKEFKSKSKTLYAEKLHKKENMMLSNGLNYFILFPSDLKEDDLDFLFENKLNIQRKDAI